MFPNMTPRFAIEEAAYSPALVSCTFSEMFGETDMIVTKDYGLTQDQLKEYVHYTPRSGSFVWAKDFQYRNGMPRYKGEIATRKRGGAHGVTLFAKTHYAHRLAFLYMEGTFPVEQIDHINRNPLDNRWENLRPVSHAENHQNKPLRKDNPSGYAGIGWKDRDQKWYTSITCNGVYEWLGSYEHLADAIIARAEAEDRLGFHENHGEAI